MAFYDGRITRHHYIARNIMHDHTARRYYHPVSDGHTGTHRHVSSEPAVLTDRDRMSGLLCLTTKNMVLGVLRGIELTVGTQKSMITDRNKCSVQNRAAEIEKCSLTQTDAISMVAPERRNNVCGSGDSGSEKSYSSSERIFSNSVVISLSLKIANLEEI